MPSPPVGAVLRISRALSGNRCSRFRDLELESPAQIFRRAQRVALVR